MERPTDISQHFFLPTLLRALPLLNQALVHGHECARGTTDRTLAMRYVLGTLSTVLTTSQAFPIDGQVDDDLQQRIIY